MKVSVADIEDELTVCPYCMWPVGGEALGCCGESSAHFTKAYQIKGRDELVREDEVEFIKEGEQ